MIIAGLIILLLACIGFVTVVDVVRDAVKARKHR